MRFLACAAGILLAATALLAQSRVDFAAAAAAANEKSTATIGPDSTQADDYAKARFEYDKFALDHARRTYEWQYRSGIVIFVLVIASVALGLWMSFLHFYQGRKGGGTMKVSKDGVEVSSPVIGLLILVVSLGFFYLYLSQVYPITEVKP